MAETAIRDLIRTHELKQVKIEDIQKLVASHYRVSRADILSSRRTAAVAKSRQVAMFLAMMLTSRSAPEIGRRFGGRDHHTVLHAVRKIDALTRTDGALRDEIELLKQTLEKLSKGPASANAWFEAHLPKAPEATPPAELPAPLPGLDAPVAYGWTASYRVAAVAGAQNLPFYLHFSSEEDHRRALEAARVGGERLLKALRNGRYNARREYAEALDYYLADLPKTAGVGNILIANDQVRILHAMFLADAAFLPVGFASRLKSVISNQFALNAFYDVVQRHNEAVNAGTWSQPFPLDATKRFFGVVEDHTPRWFEPQVEKGLRQVEQAEPPPTPPEPAPTSAIEPPLLPPGTPDAKNSWRRQMATAANAVWETFVQGQTMPVAQDEWRKAADGLSEHIRPIIDFLRAQEEGKI